jgi:hypothetical protein
LSPVLQKDYPDILVKFCKVLKELRLDYNVGIFITGVENLSTKMDQQKLDSFILLLRSCSLYFPEFFKLVLTMESRPSRAHSVAKILELLATTNVLEVKDADTFESEGRSYLEFALTYGAGTQPKGLSKAEAEESQKNLELCLARCSGSYSKGVELIYAIHRRGIHPKEQK